VWVVVFLLLAAARPALVRAQAGDDGSEPPAPGEPIGPVSVIDRIGIRPQYTTTVDVNKTVVRWDQNLKMGRDFGPVLVENTWKLGLSENSAQNNYELRDGSTKARFEYRLPGAQAFSTGATFDLRRNNSDTDLNRTVRNADDFAWFFSAGTPGKLLGRAFGLTEGVLSWDVTASAGVTQGTDIRQYFVRDVASGLFQVNRSDSTRAEGSTRALDSRLSVTVGSAWKFDLTGRVNRSTEESRTLQLQRFATPDTVPDSIGVTRQDFPTRKDGERLAWTAAWSPKATTRISFDGTYAASLDESFSTAAGTKDRSDGMDSRIGVDLKFTPLWGIKVEGGGETSRADLTYLVNAAQGRSRSRNAMDARVNFTLGERFGLLRKTEMTTEWRWEETETDNQTASLKDYRARTVGLSQVFRRPLGQQLALILKGEGSLSQTFYSDGSQDRDDLRLLADAALGYRPGPKWDTRLMGQIQQKKNLSIPGKNSGNSVTINSYFIGADVDYRLSPGVVITQKYKLTADYTFNVFSENRNVLARLTEVRTIFQGAIGQKARLNLNHTFTFRDSGQFFRKSPGEPRAYSRTQKEFYQVLEVLTGYDFTQQFRLSARQRMETRQQQRLDTGAITRQPVRLEFTGGMELNHEFRKGFSLNGRVERTQSSLEDNFWRATLTANRSF